MNTVGSESWGCNPEDTARMRLRLPEMGVVDREWASGMDKCDGDVPDFEHVW